MVKWFCDICDQEILDPENPTHVTAYRLRKNREDVDSGWSETDNIFKTFCHAKCADILETEVAAALDRAKRVVKNNA